MFWKTDMLTMWIARGGDASLRCGGMFPVLHAFSTCYTFHIIRCHKLKRKNQSVTFWDINIEVTSCHIIFKQGWRHGFLPGVAKLNGGLHPVGASWQKGPPFEILPNVLNRRICEARVPARRILLCWSWHTPSDCVIPGVRQNFEAKVLRAPKPNTSEYIWRTC